MDLHEIAKKLVGSITPIGESNTDDERFKNLKEMCGLVENLIMDIEDMAFANRDAHEFSVKRAKEYADKFIESTRTRNE